MPPVNYNSNPPAIWQLDADSINNFNLARLEQTFFGLIDVNDGQVWLHPGEPNIGGIQFMRNGNTFGVIENMNAQGGPPPTGGGHLKALLYLTGLSAAQLRDNRHGGFSLKKNNPIEVHVRSSLNQAAFTNFPGNFTNEDKRTMPPNWANTLRAYLTQTLVTAIPTACTIL